MSAMSDAQGIVARIASATGPGSTLSTADQSQAYLFAVQLSDAIAPPHVGAMSGAAYAPAPSALAPAPLAQYYLQTFTAQQLQDFFGYPPPSPDPPLAQAPPGSTFPAQGLGTPYYPSCWGREPIDTTREAEFPSALASGIVVGATATSPIVLTNAGPHSLAPRARVYVHGLQGSFSGAEGPWYVSTPSPSTLGLFSDELLSIPSTGSGTYSIGGAWVAFDPSRFSATLATPVESIVTTASAWLTARGY